MPNFNTPDEKTASLLFEKTASLLFENMKAVGRSIEGVAYAAIQATGETDPSVIVDGIEWYLNDPISIGPKYNTIETAIRKAIQHAVNNDLWPAEPSFIWWVLLNMRESYSACAQTNKPPVFHFGEEE